jgi:hypothetical protein
VIVVDAAGRWAASQLSPTMPIAWSVRGVTADAGDRLG